MTQSTTLFQRAEQVIPGGVNSPVHAFKAVGGNPFVVERAQGAYLYDVDGKQYIDYVGCFGPLILGHAHPTVTDQLQTALTRGTCYGATTEANVLLAEKITELMPSIEKVRLVNSGTEATMSALRLARGFTKRDKIIKFEGCYHGHGDALLAAAGSGPLTFGNPSSPGVTKGCTQDTLIATFNDLDSVKALMTHYKDQIAAIIVEPVAGNMNLVPPVPGFLEGLRSLCDEADTLLIFDEVMTGFRVGLGGAQEKYQVKPDLTCLGKIIGGGLPVGAFGGPADIMNLLSPVGPVYQAGTLSGNPMAVTAGLTTLDIISTTPDFYKTVTEKTTQLLTGLQQAADEAGIPFTTTQEGAMFGFFFTEEKTITTFQQVMDCNKEHFNQFFHSMREQGIYFAPSSFETGFLSIMHSETDIAKTLKAATIAFQSL